MINLGIAGIAILESPVLREIVTNLPNSQLRICAPNGFDLIKQLQSGKSLPNVLVVDLGMKIIDGVGATHIIKCLYPDIHVIAVIGYPNTFIVADLLDAGAKGIIVEKNLKETLSIAVNLVITVGSFFDKDIKTLMPVELIKNTYYKPSQIEYMLNPKEKMFLQLTATTISYNDIAALMNIGKDSIYNYQRSLKEKLGLKSRHEFMLYALQHGIAKVVRFHSASFE